MHLMKLTAKFQKAFDYLWTVIDYGDRERLLQHMQGISMTHGAVDFYWQFH